MKCPHCLVEFHDNPQETFISVDVDGGWVAVWMKCSKCKRLIISLKTGAPQLHPQTRQPVGVAQEKRTFLAYPKGAMRPPCPSQVPTALAEDYNEACLVLT